jgi:hypothetical protein
LADLLTSIYDSRYCGIFPSLRLTQAHSEECKEKESITHRYVTLITLLKCTEVYIHLFIKLLTLFSDRVDSSF